MTKMAATTSIYDKNFQKYSPTVIVKLGIEQYVLKLYKIYINDDPELTLTYFTTMSNLATLVFVLIAGPGDCLQNHWSSGLNTHLIEYHLLAHLSHRLIGELIVYTGIRRPSVVRQHFQMTSSLKL